MRSIQSPDMMRGFPAGSYRFIPAVFQYSSGATSGFEIERVRFDRWQPLAEGFAQAANYIRAAGRPPRIFFADMIDSHSSGKNSSSIFL
jgi:hypothetical protein